MNREIKFRAWCKAMQQFLPNIQNHLGNDEWAFGNILKENGNRFQVNQYTGLKDKNGKEIYEGDILISSFGEGKPIKLCFGEFKDATDDYEDSCTRVGFYWHESDGTLSSFGKSINGDMNYCEVVGNIYENPELCSQPLT